MTARADEFNEWNDKEEPNWFEYSIQLEHFNQSQKILYQRTSDGFIHAMNTNLVLNVVMIDCFEYSHVGIWYILDAILSLSERISFKFRFGKNWKRRIIQHPITNVLYVIVLRIYSFQSLLR